MNDPRDVLLGAIAAELERAMQAQRVNQKQLHQRAHLHERTVSRLLRAFPSEVTTVAKAFDALGYRVTFVVEPRD